MKNNDLKFEPQLTEIDKGKEGEIAETGLACDWDAFDSMTPEPEMVL